MKTFKGTKGEWGLTYKSIDGIPHAHTYTVNCFHTGTVQIKKGVAKIFAGHTKEGEANAKLIASAPELLNALKNVLEGFKLAINDNGLKGFNNFIQEGNEAIEKATE